MRGDHRHGRRMLGLSVISVVSALVVIGPIGTAEAQPSTPRTNVGWTASAGVARVAAPAAGVTLQTEEAVLTKADMDFVIKVRLAGLWEIPASKMAMTKGVAPRVREIGQMIASQHVRLDALSRKAAEDVNVQLPDRPTDEQARWLDEMSDAEGADFDDVYVARLRAAHGKIFPVIGAIRSSTENATVRKLAQSANAFVLTHLTLLESTGLVRYEELAKVAPPATGPIAAAAKRSSHGGIAVPLIWMILAAALITGGVFTTRMIRPQSFGTLNNRPRRRGLVDPMNTGSIPVHAADDFYPREGLRPRGSAHRYPPAERQYPRRVAR